MSARYLLLASVGLAVSVAAGCGTSAAPSQKSQSSGAPATVSVVAVESHKLNTNLSLPAQTMAYESVAIFPKVTGFIF